MIRLSSSIPSLSAITAPISRISPSMPGTGPGDVSMSTSASTRSGGRAPPGGRPSRPSSGRAAGTGRRRRRPRPRACRPPCGRACRRTRPAGVSLSPWPRWSNVTTWWRRRERVHVVGEVLLRAAEAVHQQQRRAAAPLRSTSMPTPSSVTTRMSRPPRAVPIARAVAGRARTIVTRPGRLPATGPEPVGYGRWRRKSSEQPAPKRSAGGVSACAWS